MWRSAGCVCLNSGKMSFEKDKTNARKKFGRTWKEEFSKCLNLAKGGAKEIRRVDERKLFLKIHGSEWAPMRRGGEK